MNRFFILAIFCWAIPAGAESTLPIGTSAKDKLFNQEKPYLLCKDPIKAPGCGDLCSVMKINYEEMRDINGRDINPKRGLVKPEYYDLNGLQQRKISVSLEPPYKATEIKKEPAGTMFMLDTPEEIKQQHPKSPYKIESVNEDKEQANEPKSQVTTYEVGNVASKDCKWATIWVHGATPWRGGLGMADNLFGGAFNRMKRLAQDNQGLYYSPTIQDFGDERGLVALIKHIRSTSCPQGKIILNCGSAGTYPCWQLASKKDVVKELSGMVLIGSGGAPPGFENSEFAKARIPLLLTQGEHQNPPDLQKLVEKVRKDDPNYPIRFMAFKDGGHMTPLRMLDWKATMNCMLNQAPDIGDSRSESKAQQKSGTR